MPLTKVQGGLIESTNEPIILGAGSSTGTASQPLQVTGGAYVSGRLGIGTTNPVGIVQVGTGTSTFAITGTGSVGIGTTNPTERVHIYSPSGYTVKIEGESTCGIDIDAKTSLVPTASANIIFRKSGTTRWYLGGFNVGTLGGTDDFTLYSGLVNNQYPFTAQWATGRVGIGATNPLERFQVGAGSTELFVVSGIGSVGIGVTRPRGKLEIVSYQPYISAPRKILVASAFDDQNNLGSNVLSLFGSAESLGGAIGFNVEDIAIPSSLTAPPDQPAIGVTVSQNYLNRACGLLTFHNQSTAGKSPNGTTFNLYGGLGLGHGNTPNLRTLNHYAMIDGNGNVGIGTTLSGAEVAFHRPRIVLAYDAAALVNSTAAAAGCFAKAQMTNCPSTSTTYDVFRFLNKVGNVTSSGFMSGWLMINIISNSSGAHQSAYMYTVLSTGNGTADANYTLAYSIIRGTNPISSIAVANDGVGGAIKLQITTGANGTISPCKAYAWFIGQGSNGMFDSSSSM